jgi:hypothetical protein
MFPSLKKRLIATSETAGLPFGKWKFFDVSELENAFLLHQWNGRIPVCVMTIFRRFGAKRPGTRSGSENFGTFRSLRKRILPSGKASGLLFAKCQFWKTFRHLKIFPTEKLNGRAPVREVAIFGRFGGWGGVFYPPA